MTTMPECRPGFVSLNPQLYGAAAASASAPECNYAWDGFAWQPAGDTCPKGSTCVADSAWPGGTFLGEMRTGPCPPTPD